MADSPTLNAGDKVVLYGAMALYSFATIAMEVIYFHLLLIASSYLQAHFVISIAFLGIGAGGFVSFYLKRLGYRVTLYVSSLLFLLSMAAAYYNITHIAELRYPWFLVLPFFFGSVVISSLFAYENTNRIYFANLVAAAVGVAYPVFAVPALSSENALIVLLFVPAAALALMFLGGKHIVTRILAGATAIPLIIGIALLLRHNFSVPEEIPTEDFRTIVDEQLRYERDKDFMERAFVADGEVYRLDVGEYDRMRVRNILSHVEYVDYVDLNQDIVLGPMQERLSKHFATRNLWPIFFSKDSLLGRIDLVLDDVKDIGMAINGVIVDWMDDYNGSYYDPRFPYVPDTNAFVVGLSADGIVKSVRRHDPASASGIEINPIILEIMSEDHPIAIFAQQPYEGYEVFSGEGRHFLEKSDTKYDMISLMNIHPEHASISTIAAEYFHTVEGTQVLLRSLTDRGMIAYEEIINQRRTEFFLLKFLNTARAALEAEGAQNIRDHILIYEWDFWSGANAFKTILLKRTPFTEEELQRFATHYDGMDYYHPNILVHPTIETGSALETFLNHEDPLLEMVDLPTVFTTVDFQREVMGRLRTDSDIRFVNDLYRQAGGIYRLRQIDEEQEARLMSIFSGAGVPYEIDLRPATDDKPFPFAVYEDKSEVWDLMRVVLLAALLLFIPVIGRIYRQFKARSGIVSIHVLYFAVLGFSYMLVEIVLIQNFERFIGSPAYSTLIVLGGFLLFNGIGSLISRRFPRWLLYACFIAIPILLFVMLTFLGDFFSAFGHLEFGGRVVVSILLLLPITILMGLPFPNALERTKMLASPEYGALMFGVNGVFSTVGATASGFIGLTLGFRASYQIGIVGYLVAIGLFVLMDVVAARSEPA